MTSTTLPAANLPRTRASSGTGERRELSADWVLQVVSGPAPEELASQTIPATVPGCVHTDLLAAGVIPDPYLDDNESLVRWVSLRDWRYSTTFGWTGREMAEHDRHDLVLDGVDTAATVELNGVVIAQPRNMHRSYRIDVREHLQVGDNELVVTFTSAVRYADAQSLALGYRPQVNHHPFNAIRKMASSFGWDWGIDTATVGLWKPVAIESWSPARLSCVRPFATVDLPDDASEATRHAPGRLDVHIEVERSGDDALHIDVRVGDRNATTTVAPGQSSAVVGIDVPDAELWWPRGYGWQPLYNVEVAVSPSGETAPCDTWAGRVGFRDVELRMEPDDQGTSFDVVVNKQRIWVKGANWIPDDAFPHRITRDRYAARIAQAESAGMNLLRVWGGGIYEADDFYDLCDERGILTWQDFLFSCAAYAEEEPLRSEVAAEARENIVRLLPHPSLVVWNGSNENIWGWHDWRWRTRLQGKTWGLGYYMEMLPQLLAELDPSRPYTPSSPWSGSLDVHPNDPDHGSMHNWQLWNQLDYPHYRDTVPRFMAEFGWQGPPAWSTIKQAISDDPLTPESPGMQVHQKAVSGNDKLTDGLVNHLPFPDDTEDWHWAMQLTQATAMNVAIEHLRSWAPRCSGAVMWQLNDCWPVTSWSAVDGYGRAKPLLHALRHAYADRLVTIQPRAVDGGHGLGSLVAAVVNDTAEEWRGDVVIERRGYDGTIIASASLPVSVAPRGVGTVRVPDDVATPGVEAAELLVASMDGVRGSWFYAEPKDSKLESPAMSVASGRVPGGVEVRATAECLVRDLALLADKIDPDAEVDDGLVTLLPGETVTFVVRCSDDVDPQQFARPDVLRSVNQLVARWAQ